MLSLDFFKNLFTDLFFMLSFLVCITLFFSAGLYLDSKPPRLLYSVEGHFSFPTISTEWNPLLDNAPKATSRYFANSLTVRFYTITLYDYEGISLLARQHNLKISTLLSINHIQNIADFKTGRKVQIPNQDGILYRVQYFDNLKRIANKFNIPMELLIETNNLDDKKIYPGLELFIPEKTLPDRVTDHIFNGFLSYPIAGRIQTLFGTATNSLVDIDQYNEGITFSTLTDQAVYAADSGFVVETGLHPTYGYYIVINHQKNLQSFYGYLKYPTIKTGSKVDRETVIGYVGNSGVSRGQILHFSLFKNNKAVDPLDYLK